MEIRQLTCKGSLEDKRDNAGKRPLTVPVAKEALGNSGKCMCFIYFNHHDVLHQVECKNRNKNPAARQEICPLPPKKSIFTKNMLYLLTCNRIIKDIFKLWVLFSNTVKTDGCNLHRRKLFRVCVIFKTVEKCWELRELLLPALLSWLSRGQFCNPTNTHTRPLWLIAQLPGWKYPLRTHQKPPSDADGHTENRTVLSEVIQLSGPPKTGTGIQTPVSLVQGSCHDGRCWCLYPRAWLIIIRLPVHSQLPVHLTLKSWMKTESSPSCLLPPSLTPPTAQGTTEMTLSLSFVAN